LSKTIINALEAGHVRISRPSIVEIDTVRAIADGHIIYRAGTTVYLVDEIPGEYLYQVESDDPSIEETFTQWGIEEAEAEVAEAAAAAAEAASEEE
jgi:putative RNA 2'-phosphotransferase